MLLLAGLAILGQAVPARLPLFPREDLHVFTAGRMSWFAV